MFGKILRYDFPSFSFVQYNGGVNGIVVEALSELRVRFPSTTAFATCDSPRSILLSAFLYYTSK